MRRQVADVAGNCRGARRKTCCPPCDRTVLLRLGAFGRASPNAELRSARRSDDRRFVCVPFCKPPLRLAAFLRTRARAPGNMLAALCPARRGVSILTRFHSPLMKPTAEGPHVGHTVRLPTGFGSGNAEARAQQEDNYSMVKQFFNGRVLRPGRKAEQCRQAGRTCADPRGRVAYLCFYAAA